MIEVLVAIIFLGVATAVAFTQLVTIQCEHQNDYMGSYGKTGKVFE